MTRLQKFLADAGIGSRRYCEELIKSGKVLLNGEVAKIGSIVEHNDEVLYLNKKIESSIHQDRVILLNKPVGAVVSNSINESNNLAKDYLPDPVIRWINIGRLDINSSGLLLFTNNGKLANAIAHPSSGFDREYLVRARGHWNSKKNQMALSGIKIEKEILKFSDIYVHEEKTTGSNHWFTVCLMTGRNKEVRKIFAALDMQVNRLKRVRFGPIFLSDKLREGSWKELTEKEIDSLKSYGSTNL